MNSISLTNTNFEQLDALLLKTSSASMFHSREYLQLVSDHLGCYMGYLGVVDSGKLIGVLPVCMKENETYGNIINSSPYYGSYGGPVIDPNLSLEKQDEVNERLLKDYAHLAKNSGCPVSTIVTSPFDHQRDYYSIEYHHTDRRVAQITTLPQPGKETVRDVLFNSRFSESCRRAIRKAEKSGVEVEIATEAGDELDQFYSIYKRNMVRFDAPIKEKNFFEEAFRVCNCQLVWAKYDNKLIGGLFLFFYKDMVDYFNPGVDHDYQHVRPNNLLIYKSMERAIQEGFLYWNFEGTPIGNDSLFRFKRSFGADVFPYETITYFHDDSYKALITLTPKELHEQYPYFYTIPFSMLR